MDDPGMDDPGNGRNAQSTTPSAASSSPETPLADERSPRIDVVVVGASAGGVSALQTLIGGLKPDVEVAIIVVLHVSPTGSSVLADILRRRSDLRVLAACDQIALERGTVLVAPPDHHVVLEGAVARTVRTAKVNGHRPAIDPTFETASRAFGPRVLGVLLSGMLDDGVAGLGAIREAGGITAVQDPDEAPYPAMPRTAIQAGVVDHVMPVAALVDLVSSTADGPGPLVPVSELAVAEGAFGTRPRDQGHLTSITCPNCGGSLWRRHVGGVEHYECRVGHRYAPESLFTLQGESLDDALWAAHRALLERGDLAQRMAARMRRSGQDATARRYDRQREEAERRAVILHQALMESRTVGGDDEVAEGPAAMVDAQPDGIPG